jgi:hypothetical protein
MTIADSQLDPVDWVQCAFPAVDALCTVTMAMQGDIVAWRCEVPEAARAAVAWRVAVGHAARVLSVRPDLFIDWFGSANSCFEQMLPTYRYESIYRHGLLVDVGTLEQPAPIDRFYGFLGETLLHELLWNSDRGLGLPVLLEGHDWSVIDHGGDKLAIYRPATGLAFRLWESKALRSASKTVGKVVADAADQLEVHAASYLGRFAVTLARAAVDDDLASFAGMLPDLWADNDPRAGFGIAVVTHQANGAHQGFAQLETRFELPATNKSGQLTLLGDLEAFGESVRMVLWKGMGLWNAP